MTDMYQELIEVFKVEIGRWYNEYRGFQVFDFISIMIWQFPILVFRRYRDNHEWDGPVNTYTLGIIGYTFQFGPYE